MKNLIYLILFTGIVVRAQAQNKFQRKYLVRDSIYYSMLKSVELNNGSFLTLTSYNNLGATAPQLHVMNCFPNGTTNWYKKHDCVGFMDFTDFTLHSNNQIGVSGVYNFSDPVYILLDSSGNILSTTEYTFSSYASFNGIFSNGSNHNVMMGYLSQFNKGIIVETDLSGNVHRADEYEINNHPVVFNTGLLLRNDNRLFTGPVSMNLGTHQRNQVGVLVTDPSGNPLWALQTGDSSFTMSTLSAMELPDQSILIAGVATQQVPFFASYPYLIKVNPNGSSAWMNVYQTSDIFTMYSATVAMNSNIVLTGYNLPSSGPETTFTCILDSGGHVLFTPSYSEPVFGLDGIDATACSDGSILITAKTPDGNGFNSTYLLKTDSTFHGACNESSLNVSELNLITYDSTGFTQQTSNVSAAAFSLNNFSSSMITPIESDPCLPNGLDELKENSSSLHAYVENDILYIHYSGINSGKVDFTLYDLSGKQLQSFSDQSQSGENSFEKEIGHPTKGIYFLQCNSGEENLSRLILIAY
ncbi:MAG: T9SS type A sorting domain-containing protein [Bacteroidia bacterium]